MCEGLSVRGDEVEGPVDGAVEGQRSGFGERGIEW